MAKNLDFIVNDAKSFSSWLKKFSLIDKSLLVEVDTKNQCFVAKSYNEEKSVVKYSMISFNDSGFTLKKPAEDFIKIGIFNIAAVIKSLDHFSSGEFSLQVQYEEVLSGKTPEFAGVAILLKSSSLKVKLECTSLNIFQYIPTPLFEDKIAKTTTITPFNLSSGTIEKINSLSELDKDKDYLFLEFIIRDSRVLVSGKSFELDIAESISEEKIVFSVYKKQFAKIDTENYTVEFGEEKLIFRSDDSNTVTVISMVERDKKYDENPNTF
jgi:hypothetical protein